jgi:hypothetical protein
VLVQPAHYEVEGRFEMPIFRVSDGHMVCHFLECHEITYQLTYYRRHARFEPVLTSDFSVFINTISTSSRPYPLHHLIYSACPQPFTWTLPRKNSAYFLLAGPFGFFPSFLALTSATFAETFLVSVLFPFVCTFFGATLLTPGFSDLPTDCIACLSSADLVSTCLYRPERKGV